MKKALFLLILPVFCFGGDASHLDATPRSRAGHVHIGNGVALSQQQSQVQSSEVRQQLLEGSKGHQTDDTHESSMASDLEEMRQELGSWKKELAEQIENLGTEAEQCEYRAGRWTRIGKRANESHKKHVFILHDIIGILVGCVLIALKEDKNQPSECVISEEPQDKSDLEKKEKEPRKNQWSQALKVLGSVIVAGSFLKVVYDGYQYHKIS